jgi:hypothetical protein
VRSRVGSGGSNNLHSSVVKNEAAAAIAQKATLSDAAVVTPLPKLKSKDS